MTPHQKTRIGDDITDWELKTAAKALRETRGWLAQAEWELKMARQEIKDAREQEMNSSLYGI